MNNKLCVLQFFESVHENMFKKLQNRETLYERKAKK